MPTIPLRFLRSSSAQPAGSTLITGTIITDEMQRFVGTVDAAGDDVIFQNTGGETLPYTTEGTYPGPAGVSVSPATTPGGAGTFFDGSITFPDTADFYGTQHIVEYYPGGGFRYRAVLDCPDVDVTSVTRSGSTYTVTCTAQSFGLYGDFLTSPVAITSFEFDFQGTIVEITGASISYIGLTGFNEPTYQASASFTFDPGASGVSRVRATNSYGHKSHWITLGLHPIPEFDYSIDGAAATRIDSRTDQPVSTPLDVSPTSLVFTLDASRSYDPSGTIAHWEWRSNSGVIGTAPTLSLDFTTIAESTQNGDMKFFIELWIKDNHGNQSQLDCWFFAELSQQFGFLRDRSDASIWAIPEKHSGVKGVQFYHTRSTVAARVAREWVPGADKPSIWRAESGDLMMMALKDGGYKLFASTDDARNVEEL